jgi:hypothetical protein
MIDMPKNWSWTSLPASRWTLTFLTVIAASMLLNSAISKPQEITGKYKLPPDIQKAYNHLKANPPYIAPSSSQTPSATTGGDFLLTLLVSTGIASLILRKKRPLEPSACLRCHSTGMPRPVYPGSAFFGCLFFCLLIVPWFFYRTWRANNRTFVCPVCGSSNLIPLSTPQGQRITAANRQIN